MQKGKFRLAALLAGCFIFIVTVFGKAMISVAADDAMEDEGVKVEPEARVTRQYTLTEEPVEGGTLTTPELLTAYFAPTQLPVLYLTTENGAPIASNKNYVDGSLQIGNQAVYSCAFRGRGNASWTTYPQKSYLLKFDEKVSFLGMKPSRKWVLRSNYGDPAIVRDAVATDIAREMDALSFTAETYAVDVVLNGKYIGIYQLAEKVEVAEDKVELFSIEEEYPFDENRMLTYGQLCRGEEYVLEPEDTAFLMETSFDFYNEHVYGLEYFKVGHLPSTFITYPEPVAGNQQAIDAAIEYMRLTDAAIVSGENIEAYIDMDSFVDWFIVMELTFNTDSSFNRSTYLYKRPGGKLMIGPVWDFDHAFGNFKFDEPTYQSWCTGEAIYAMCQHHWPDDLVKNDAFMEKVKCRFDEKKDALSKIIEESVFVHMNQVAASGTYQSHCYGVELDTNPEGITTFLQKRLAWMDESLHSDNYNRHPATMSINWEPQTTEEGSGEAGENSENIPEGQVEETFPVIDETTE